MTRWYILGLLFICGCPADRGVRFSHLTHAGKAGLTCASCHKGLQKDDGTKVAHLPSDRQCLTCHRSSHKGNPPSGSCVGCHSGEPHEARKAGMTRQLRFAHDKHLQNNRGQCFPCHSSVLKKATTTSKLLPGHTECFTCHKSKWTNLECGYCHRSLSLYAIKPKAGFAHEGDFLRNHGRVASSRTGLCAQCHTQVYCVTCHDPKVARFRASIRWPEKITNSFIHRGDYIGRHAIEANTAADSCVRCHTRRECNDCHDSRGVGPGSKRNPHPPGWVSISGGPNLHGSAARRRIVTCAGCHDRGAASNCVQCHRVGGVGGNPHPPGWRSRLSKHKDRVCQVCH